MKNKILILGATGMLGNGLISSFKKYPNLEVFGTIRDKETKYFPDEILKWIIPNIDIENWNNLIKLFGFIKPDIVLNCVGLIKQIMGDQDNEAAIYMNALFPHRLSALCQASGARMIHFSTDCVFSGRKGNYCESDPSDALDIYGKTKYLGEVKDNHCLTIRTSIIGHGLESHVSLVDWFLAQKGEIKGYKNVIYSGLPTVEIGQIITEKIIPNQRLKGLYHVSADPISKYELLKLVSAIYDKKIKIQPVDQPVSDMSLNSDRFRKKIGYQPPAWPNLIKKMYHYYKTNPNFIKF